MFRALHNRAHLFSYHQSFINHRLHFRVCRVFTLRMEVGFLSCRCYMEKILLVTLSVADMCCRTWLSREAVVMVWWRWWLLFGVVAAACGGYGVVVMVKVK